ncbi:hypothetical protein D9M72_543990 [compost metagenome]
MRIVLEFRRKSHRFRSEEKDVAGEVTDIRVGGFAVGRERIDALGLQSLPGGLDAFVHRHDGEVVVVQAGAAKFGVGKIKAQRLHEVQFGARDGSQADGVARIAGNFRSVEEDAEHRPILATSGLSASRAAVWRGRGH